MTATKIQARPETTAAETGPELNGKLARQVLDILAEAAPRESVRLPVRPALAYRVPSPGVRYYF